MKKYFASFILLTLSCFNTHAMLTYETTLAVIGPHKKERFPTYAAADRRLYVSGGLTFTYPTDLFITTPTITITVSTPTPVSDTAYIAQISAEDSTSATVLVYKNTSGVLTEASTGEVSIHFVAFGN